MHLVELLIGLAVLAGGITALLAYSLGIRDIGRIATIALDAASILTVGLFAIGGALIVGIRLIEATNIPYIDNAPLAVLTLISLRWVIQTRKGLDNALQERSRANDAG